MKKQIYEKKIKDEKFFVYSIQFNDLYELVDYIKTEPIAPYWKEYELASMVEDFESTGTHTLQEALDLCLSPTLEMEITYLNNVKKLVEKSKVLTHKRRMESHFYGSYVSIPKYLSGNPRCMKKINRVNQNRMIKIYLNSSYPSYIPQSFIMIRGMSIVFLIQCLEMIGYVVDFHFFDLSFRDEELFYSDILLKHPEELLDIRNTYFPLCHPSFLRRVIIAVEERMNFSNFSWSLGYGSPASDWMVKNFLKLDKQSILINSFDFVRNLKTEEASLYCSIEQLIDQYHLEDILDKEDINNIKVMKKVLQKN